MSSVSRRNFIKLAAATGAASLLAPAIGSSAAKSKTAGHIVVIGGGFGGATCANYIRKYDTGIQVTLIEPNETYISCPLSNTVLAGLNTLDFISHSYDKLHQKRGVEIIHERATEVDPDGKKVKLQSGKYYPYDRLVLSPGISFRWDQIAGFDEAQTEVMPHAWTGGGQQIALLRRQIEGMKDGGVVIIAVPPQPFRAPPAPYERASLIAYYLKTKKAKCKVLIVDASEPRADLIALFQAAWKDLYPGMIEWVKARRVARVDVKTMTLFLESGESFHGDVINLIPPQQAGIIAKMAGLTDPDGWCPVDQTTFESIKHKGVHVIGDACAAGDMPKIGHAASSQGKVCAASVVSALRGVSMPEPVHSTGIYSIIGPKYAISTAGTYRLTNGRIKAVSLDVSPLQASRRSRAKEAEYVGGWYRAITSEMFMR
jgi:sulfide dehydrogenase [flavocytochrome c] flavoprotein subunit